LVENNISP